MLGFLCLFQVNPIVSNKGQRKRRQNFELNWSTQQRVKKHHKNPRYRERNKL